MNELLLPRFTDRNQKDATPPCESFATPPSVEAPPLQGPTGNSSELGSSAEETEAASSAWGNSSVVPGSLEATWAEDEVSDEGLLRCGFSPGKSFRSDHRVREEGLSAGELGDFPKSKTFILHTTQGHS